MPFSEKARREIYGLLKSQDDALNKQLWKNINLLATTSREDMLLRKFAQPKPDGGERMIFNAKPEWAFLQYLLREWLRRVLPPTLDCNELGLGVVGAIAPHKFSKYALVVDIKDAYGHVTAPRLRRAFAQCLPSFKISGETLDFICYLLTYH